MAYAWTAKYGYYSLGEGSSHGHAPLQGVYTTDPKFHVVTGSTLFTIPESTELPTPKSLSSATYEVANTRIKTLTDYDYITVIPYLEYDADYPAMSAMYHKLTDVLERLIPGCLFYSRPLIAACMGEFGYSYETFVWLTDINIIISSYGDVYEIDNNNMLNRVISQGNYFQSGYCTANFNPVSQTNWHTDAYVYISFIYSGSWYRNYFSVAYNENPQTHEAIESWYTIWYDTNRTSYRQNELNQYLIGTPSNPRYKYKTDPANPETDPYIPPLSPLNPSGPGGGNGTHDPEHDSDPAPIPDITQFTDIADTGLVSVWNPTLAQLGNLAKILWNDNFAAAIYNFFNKPIDVIIGLSIVPLTVSGTASVLKFGYINPGQYGVAMDQVDTQYYEVDCGGFNCDLIWGSYLDYQTRFQIFLPFIGFKPLQAEDVMGHELRVKYHVDIVTGCCIAYILTDNFCTYTFSGNCSYQIPITEQGFENIVGSLIQTAGTIGAAIIAPEAAAGPAALAAAGSSLNTMGAKPTYQKSGGMGGNSAFMGMRKPFLISYVPRACVPANQNKIMGYPSYQTKQLNQVTGYTEVLEVHLNGIGATDTEKAEILAALKEGVIL